MKSCYEPAYRGSKQLGPATGTCDKDGFVKVERKRTKKPPSRNQCGTALAGPNMLRWAIPTTQLYVSRLHHTTKVKEIVEYVRAKTSWTCKSREVGVTP